jgi:hypothetical protein
MPKAKGSVQHLQQLKAAFEQGVSQTRNAVAAAQRSLPHTKTTAKAAAARLAAVDTKIAEVRRETKELMHVTTASGGARAHLSMIGIDLHDTSAMYGLS